jgi:hypothetical protein
MSENTFINNEHEDPHHNCFKEAVCIDAYRVYDSCCDKDCLEDLRVYFTEENQQKVDKAFSVRMRDVEVLTVYLDLEPIPFQKGFYSVDMTFFFNVSLDVFTGPSEMSFIVCGLSVFSKKVVLYGSEGNVKIFSSDYAFEKLDSQNVQHENLPRATCQVADPIGLSAKLCEYTHHCDPSARIPDFICRRYGGPFCLRPCSKIVYVTIGLFSIIQIERNVQMLIPAYDFCIPEKQCISTSDDPCELFSKIEFPTDEFFPPKGTDHDKYGCGCHHDKHACTCSCHHKDGSTCGCHHQD